MRSVRQVSLGWSGLTTRVITHVLSDQDDTDPTLCDDGHQNWFDCSFCDQLRLSLPVTSHPDKYLLSNFHLQTPLIDIPHQITSASYWTESHHNYITNMAPTSGLRTEKYCQQLYSWSRLSVVSFVIIMSELKYLLVKFSHWRHKLSSYLSPVISVLSDPVNVSLLHSYC